MSTPNEIGSWFSTWTLVLTYFFILWAKTGRGGASWLGRGEPPRYEKNVSGHVTYQSKAHEKLYSNTSIKCSFHPSFDRQQLKMTGKSFFFITVLFRRACPHTEWDRKLIFDINIGSDLGFHILNQNWAAGGDNHPKYWEKKCLGHMTYQSKAHEKLFSNMPIKCSFNALFVCQ